MIDTGTVRLRSLGAHRGIVVLLVLFVCLAATYSLVTPLFEAPDELFHYAFVQHLADGQGLPVQDPANPGLWQQEGSQPPLYYALAALVSCWAPADDLPKVLQRNPHASIGSAQPDGNGNWRWCPAGRGWRSARQPWSPLHPCSSSSRARSTTTTSSLP